MMRGRLALLTQEVAAPVTELGLLAASERLHRSVLESLAEGVIVVGLDGQLIDANAAACEILEIEDVEAARLTEWWQPLAARHADDGCDLHIGGQVLATGEGVRDVPVQITKRDGREALLSVNYLPLRDERECVEGLLLSFRDITAPAAEARLNGELQLRLREAHDYLQAVTDSIGEGMFTLDADGCITYMNRAAEELLGWREPELHGRPVQLTCCGGGDDAVPREECAILAAQLRGETIRAEDEVFVTRDGERVPIAYTAAPLVTSEGVEGSVVVFQDISERKTREESLKRDAEALAWIARIKQALADDRFVLYAQPIIDPHSGEVVQRELLLRMQGRAGEVIAPGEFLPVAERYGLIAQIDRWVIRRGIELAATGMAVEVNVSAASVGRSRDDRVHRALPEPHRSRPGARDLRDHRDGADRR